MDILIVEDYPMVARRVERLTREILGSRLGSLKCVGRFSEAEEHLQRYTIDLMLLDLNLAGDDGFDLLKRALAASFQTIVISANVDRALEAFEYGVLDFVAKPFNAERLSKAFSRLALDETGEQTPVRFLAVKDGARIRLIPICEVTFIQGAGNYSELHLKDGTTALHEKNLDRLLILLKPQFERVHKSYLAKLSEVAGLQVYGGGRYALVLKNGETLPLGRTRYKALRERLG